MHKLYKHTQMLQIVSTHLHMTLAIGYMYMHVHTYMYACHKQTHATSMHVHGYDILWTAACTCTCMFAQLWYTFIYNVYKFNTMPNSIGLSVDTEATADMHERQSSCTI